MTDKKQNIKFIAEIPDSRKAFEIPGNRSEARLVLTMGEDQVHSCLRLILLRGLLFTMKFQVISPTENVKVPYKKVGDPVETFGAIAARDSAIRIHGVDGMAVMFAIPTINEKLLVQLLGLREKLLQVEILEGK